MWRFSYIASDYFELMPGHGKPVGGGRDQGGQGGSKGVTRDPPKVAVGAGHGQPREKKVEESGGQWVPRGDPRFRPGPGTGRGHGGVPKVEREGQRPY